MSRNALAVAIGALAAAIVYASTPRATARSAREVVCEKFQTHPKQLRGLEQWIAVNVASSKHVEITGAGHHVLGCAW